MYSIISNASKVTNNLISSIRQYVMTENVKALVLGISGGIDSALVAALAKEAITGLNVKLIGRSIPIVTNKTDEIDRAVAVGKAFCDDFKEVALDVLYAHYEAFLEAEEGFFDGKNGKIEKGNLKARLRMIYLYHLAHYNNGIVLSTDNYTEYLLGFWTLHGDVGDFGPIQNLWKTEVYKVAQVLIEEYDKMSEPSKVHALKICVVADPTDGLGVSNTDLDQLEASSYKEVDDILIKFLNHQNTAELSKHQVVKRHIHSMFKRNNPYNLQRDVII